MYSIATPDNDPIFASYVDCIILATVYAVHEGITKEEEEDMPTMTLFGKFYLWALKDAIQGKKVELIMLFFKTPISYPVLLVSCVLANGNYDQIYVRNFGEVEDKGRNALNTNQMPQMLNNPGLARATNLSPFLPKKS